MTRATQFISIVNATENNLQSVNLDIPKDKLVVVTGVSGSGKSSLVFDVIYREAESRYLGSFSSYARQFLGRMKRPEVEKIDGLSPAIAVDQKAAAWGSRSTVGTLTEIYDYLRLLFARLGKPENTRADFKLERSLFSFNSPAGACPACKGLGVEDRLDPELLIADPNKSLRQGCMKITAPNGYIIYSQVTMEVLDQVCRAEGFHVDIPWKELTSEQKRVVLYGSNRIEIPFGKHPLESRMRWSGITAKPRETGYYKGILPIMDAILKQKRNKNILRFVRTAECSSCDGTRLNANARSVRIQGLNIADMSSLALDPLQTILAELHFQESDRPVAVPILAHISRRIDVLRRLGLEHLSLNRESTSLSGGEIRRLRLAVQAGTAISGILYVFDEPSVGLHPRDTLRLIEILEELRDQGNSVIVVEHEDEFIRQADWLIDIGPAAGIHGGRVLQNIDASAIDAIPSPQIRESRTLSFFKGMERLPIPCHRRPGTSVLAVRGAAENNLKEIDVEFRLHALNVITGVSGAGKTTLTHRVLGDYLQAQIQGSSRKPGKCASIDGWKGITKVISVDQAPIGRTPRSNPATYTGLFDSIRELFAALPGSQSRGWDKGRFSFNTPGGRCEACEGAGYQQIGMHFMGAVEVLCEECNGSRFHSDTLQIRYRGRNIDDVLEMSVSEAREFFGSEARILRYLDDLENLGLGYLKLGQRSSTLSGGEAERIKLATELARPQTSHTLYILDEPTTGLHPADVHNLLQALNALVEQGHTALVIEHHIGLIAAADWVVDLGPDSGKNGGYVVAQGSPEKIADCANSYTGKAIRALLRQEPAEFIPATPRMRAQVPPRSIRFTGVSTHNLRHIDFAIPHNRITVITGVSGSGKSSLAFDTLFMEGQNRFLESFSTYARAQIGVGTRADYETASGITPTLAVDQRAITRNPRSTLGTMTGIYDLYRLLFSRRAVAGTGEKPGHSSQFSFNHQSGACPNCRGLGCITRCDPDRLITNPERSILAGAMDGTKAGKFYGDPFGQHVAALRAAGDQHDIDFTRPWAEISEPARELALHGTGDEIYDVTWSYKRGNRTGEFHFQGKWSGLASLVTAEYERKHADRRGQGMLPLMRQDPCPACLGSRLNPDASKYCIAGVTIARLAAFPAAAAMELFRTMTPDPVTAPLIQEILRRLEFLSELGLEYLSIDRGSESLSGGEAQRVKLAAQLGNGLRNLTYVLDEPTVGLHAADVGRLMNMIRQLQEAGNTVVIVEHDREVILSADHVIDLGPGAGREGGRIVAEGTPEEVAHNTASATGKYLSKPLRPAARNRLLMPGLKIRRATAHNLKNITLEIPAGGIVVITGVSGSGKSSLAFDVIHSSWERGRACGCAEISGFQNFQQVIAVDQRSRFTDPFSTPATYTGIFERVRELFARTEAARSLNLKKKHFSFADKEGRCEACQGLGQITVSMDFLSDVQIPCEKCGGTRYRQEICACRYQDKSISEVLKMTANEAAGFFERHKVLAAELEMLGRVGLGYLELGQPLRTLSGGETQRLTLAAELMKPAKGKALYLFDEPGTGLHFSDIEYLLALFHQLADQGHTLLVIEHDPQIILSADWIIDLGPEGGDRGGQLVFCGRVQEILLAENSRSGACLASLQKQVAPASSDLLG
jgi:excinuclease ABC subunit A